MEYRGTAVRILLRMPSCTSEPEPVVTPASCYTQVLASLPSTQENWIYLQVPGIWVNKCRETFCVFLSVSPSLSFSVNLPLKLKNISIFSKMLQSMHQIQHSSYLWVSKKRNGPWNWGQLLLQPYLKGAILLTERKVNFRQRLQLICIGALPDIIYANL